MPLFSDGGGGGGTSGKGAKHTGVDIDGLYEKLGRITNGVYK